MGRPDRVQKTADLPLRVPRGVAAEPSHGSPSTGEIWYGAAAAVVALFLLGGVL